MILLTLVFIILSFAWIGQYLLIPFLLMAMGIYSANEERKKNKKRK
ncbi:hypothetical protein [Staphylococcus phage PMBT8]|nr:hypothetical protein [Staphylococcus phage PMBT8]